MKKVLAALGGLVGLLAVLAIGFIIWLPPSVESICENVVPIALAELPEDVDISESEMSESCQDELNSRAMWNGGRKEQRPYFNCLAKAETMDDIATCDSDYPLE